MNKEALLKRIARTNPALVFTLADLDGRQLEDAVFEAVGCGEEVSRYRSLRLSAVLDRVAEQIGDFIERDRVRWRASRDTVVIRLEADGSSYRLWWWKHADDFETAFEAILYREPSEVTALEMAWYE